jgi:hypothetical protein
LIGETLMRAEHPGELLHEFIEARAALGSA